MKMKKKNLFGFLIQMKGESQINGNHLKLSRFQYGTNPAEKSAHNKTKRVEKKIQNCTRIVQNVYL